jgi:hypothetical protein
MVAAAHVIRRSSLLGRSRQKRLHPTAALYHHPPIRRSADPP